MSDSAGRVNEQAGPCGTDPPALEKARVRGYTDPCHPSGLRHRDDVTLHELDGEALIYDPATADTHRLNETAYFIWRLCDGLHNELHIAAALCNAYEVAPDEAAAHVGGLLVALGQRRLLAHRPEAGATHAGATP